MHWTGAELHSQAWLLHEGESVCHCCIEQSSYARCFGIEVLHASAAACLCHEQVSATQLLQAPETFEGTRLTFAADIWSFAVCMLEIITAEPQLRGSYSHPR